MHVKYEIEIPKQTWVTVRKPCCLQMDGRTHWQTDKVSHPPPPPPPTPTQTPTQTPTPPTTTTSFAGCTITHKSINTDNHNKTKQDKITLYVQAPFPIQCPLCIKQIPHKHLHISGKWCWNIYLSHKLRNIMECVSCTQNRTEFIYHKNIL